MLHDPPGLLVSFLRMRMETGDRRNPCMVQRPSRPLAHSNPSILFLSTTTSTTIPTPPIPPSTLSHRQAVTSRSRSFLRSNTFTTIQRTEALAQVTYRMFTNSNVAFTLRLPAVPPSLFVTRWSFESAPPPRRIRRHFRSRKVGSALKGCWRRGRGW